MSRDTPSATLDAPLIRVEDPAHDHCKARVKALPYRFQPEHVEVFRMTCVEIPSSGGLDPQSPRRAHHPYTPDREEPHPAQPQHQGFVRDDDRWVNIEVRGQDDRSIAAVKKQIEFTDGVYHKLTPRATVKYRRARM